MELLLKNDFTAYYGLLVSCIENISTTTVASYFELKDDQKLIYTNSNEGIAKYANKNKIELTVVNYEKFFNSLLDSFKHGREKCDLIIHDKNQQYFILNELTDTIPEYVMPFVNTKGQQPGKRKKAISQLLLSLTIIMEVPAIKAFVNKHSIRQCCFFNKQSIAPPAISAIVAFNRLNKIITNGLNMQDKAIESFSFELWEYSGNQVYNL
jgi:hypothetical protein